MDVERRYVELRAEGEGLRLAGVAMPWGETASLPWGDERFVRGAFGDPGALDVVLNRQHVRSRPLARTGGGGLEFSDTERGLMMRATMPDTAEARDVMTLVRAGVLTGLSVEFLPTTERMENEVRVIERARLTGLAVVDRATYDGAEVQARAAARLRATQALSRRKVVFL